MLNLPRTILCDIDGVLLRHHGNLTAQAITPPQILPGVLEEINAWNARGDHIVLVTGRKESMRTITQQQLSEAGIFYDQLVMGVTSGQRVLINDLKPYSSEPTALAVNLVRNHGLAEDK